jgi:hypothetical protein
MKNEIILPIILNNLYINELSKVKYDTKNYFLLKNFTKKIKTHKWESINMSNCIKIEEPSNEMTIEYLFKHKPNKSKHRLDHCVGSMAYITENTLALGSYFNFSIFLFDCKENILEKIIGDDNKTDNTPNSDSNSDSDDKSYYSNFSFVNKKYDLAVNIQRGTVDMIKIIDDHMLGAYDSYNKRYRICDYIKRTIVKEITIKTSLIKNLDAFYTAGKIFHINENISFKVRSEDDTKLDKFNISAFNDYLAFNNDKRIYIYHKEDSRYNKVYKSDVTNGISTDLIAYKDNTYIFGNNKGELKILSLADKLPSTKIKHQNGQITALYSFNNKLLISSNNFGVIKIYDYYTLYTTSSINAYCPISKILCLPNNQLIALSTEKGTARKKECTCDCCEMCYDQRQDESEEYYDLSFILTWDLREKDAYSTGFKHNKMISAFIQLKKDIYVSAFKDTVWLWSGNRYTDSIAFSDTILKLKRLNDTMFFVILNKSAYLYEEVKQIKSLNGFCQDPIKVIDENSYIYSISNYSIFYHNVITGYDKLIAEDVVLDDDIVSAQGKIFYLKNKILYYFDTQTLNSRPIEKGGIVVTFNLEDFNTITFLTEKGKVFELNVENLKITEL